MATEIIMPAVSTSSTEAVLARWAKNEGEPVKKGEVVAEIETDKVVIELEAEADGILAKRFVSDGDTVAYGAPMGVILAPGEAMPAAPAGGSAPQKSVAESTTSTVKENKKIGETSARIFASPLARNLALLHDLDLAHIEGSGPNGRVVKRDIEAAVAAPRPVETVAAPERPIPKPVKDVRQASPAAQDYEEIPHTSMRRVIAQRLSESKQQVPHFYLTVDCQLDELLALRKQINNSVPDVKVSVNDFVVRAVAVALKKVPAANASWTDTAIRRYRTVDVSVAVATPNGLITPVVRNVDAKSLGAISGEVKDLAERARQGKLRPDEYQGGGFSISNLGMYGVKEFAAIINPPQACILAVGAGEQRAVVRDGAIVPATVMSCTLSVDHRVVDGAVGAEFLAAFKTLIEKPMGLLV